MRKLALFFWLVAPLMGQSQKIMLRSVTEVDVNTIAYPNLAGNTTSSQPHKGTVRLLDGSELKGKITFFKKKDVFTRVKVNTGTEKKEIMAEQIAAITLDPIIYERAYPNNFKNVEKNFQRGYIVLPTGDKLKGSVAQLRDFSDYDFFVYNVAFLPEGSTVASVFKGGRLVEFGQEMNGTINVWDGYADGYVFRLVDGRFRLSRNPYSKTKNEFFTGIKNQLADSLRKQAMGQTVASGLQNGQSLNESIENAANVGSAITEVLGSVEINKKEYLIFDTLTKSVISVNKNNFKEEIQHLRSACSFSGEPSWDKLAGFKPGDKVQAIVIIETKY
jgi:hypothetical protein